MSRSTISTFQLFERFPDEGSARAYLESRLWKRGASCPKCDSKADAVPRTGKPGFRFCNRCRLDFTVRTGTIFERSHVPLHKWLYAMYLLVTARKGISSMQLAKEIGITQKSAWFLLQRLREACKGHAGMLSGTVEADETHIGGLEGNRHMHDRIRKGRKEKTVVFGMRQRGGDTMAMVVEGTGGRGLQAAIQTHVEPGSRIMTDEYAGYIALEKLGFEHGSVKHAVEELVRGDVHTNGIDSVWAVLKRGLHGVYHHVSRKHLGRYVDEFAFRLSAGKVQRHTWRRLDSLVDLVAGCRITYGQLTTGLGRENSGKQLRQ
jgi:transposase-like protein